MSFYHTESEAEISMKKADAIFDIGDTVYIPAHITGMQYYTGSGFVYSIKESDRMVKEADCRTVNETVSHQRASVAVHVDAAELNAVTEKITELTGLIEKANSIIDELASKDIEIGIQAIRA